MYFVLGAIKMWFKLAATLFASTPGSQRKDDSRREQIYDLISYT